MEKKIGIYEWKQVQVKMRVIFDENTKNIFMCNHIMYNHLTNTSVPKNVFKILFCVKKNV